MAYPSRDVEYGVTVTKVCLVVYMFCIVSKMPLRLCIEVEDPVPGKEEATQ